MRDNTQKYAPLSQLEAPMPRSKTTPSPLIYSASSLEAYQEGKTPQRPIVNIPA